MDERKEGGEEGGGMMGGAVSQFRAVGTRDRIWTEVGPCRWSSCDKDGNGGGGQRLEEEDDGNREGDMPAGWPGMLGGRGAHSVR